MTPATHLPRVGSIELHTAYVLVRDLSGGAERIDLGVAVRSLEVAAAAAWFVARQRWGVEARTTRGRLGGIAQYDVHAPVRAGGVR